MSVHVVIQPTAGFGAEVTEPLLGVRQLIAGADEIGMPISFDALSPQGACVPGRNAGAAVTRGPGGRPVLVLQLDTVNMTLSSGQSEEGTRELADFCRELAWEAAKLAAEIDPEGEPVAPDRPDRYLVVLGGSGGDYR